MHLFKQASGVATRAEYAPKDPVRTEIATRLNLVCRKMPPPEFEALVSELYQLRIRHGDPMA